MKLRCKECDYHLKETDKPTAVCPECGSVYLIDASVDLAQQKNKSSSVIQWRISENKKWARLRFNLLIIVAALMSGVIYLYYVCEQVNGGNCTGLTKFLFGIVKILFFIGR